MSKFSVFVNDVKDHARAIVQRIGLIPKDERGLSAFARIIEINMPAGVEIKEIYLCPEGIELHTLNFDGDGQLDIITLKLNQFFRFDSFNYPKQKIRFKPRKIEVSPW